ncbi:MAG: peptidoglycan-binding protein, partial [Spirochaetales bacterium]|nr:peptidoglycan-binding protein [Spirochaetales bacterium]
NGENDDVVDPASGNEIARIASNSLSTYIVIPGADHTFGVFTDPDFNALGETIANTMQWFATTL